MALKHTHDHKIVLHLAYDISDDKRRSDCTSGCLTMEHRCSIVCSSAWWTEQLAKMQKMIKRTIKAKDDQVRIYFVCEACLKRIWVSNAGQDVLHGDDEHRRVSLLGGGCLEQPTTRHLTRVIAHLKNRPYPLDPRDLRFS